MNEDLDEENYLCNDMSSQSFKKEEMCELYIQRHSSEERYDIYRISIKINKKIKKTKKSTRKTKYVKRWKNIKLQ